MMYDGDDDDGDDDDGGDDDADDEYVGPDFDERVKCNERNALGAQ